MEECLSERPAVNGRSSGEAPTALRAEDKKAQRR